MSRSRRRRHVRRNHHRPPRIRRLAPPGAPPATLVASPDAVETKATVITYDVDGYDEETLDDLNAIKIDPDSDRVTWIQVRGYRDVGSLETLAEGHVLPPNGFLRKNRQKTTGLAKL